MFRFILKLFSVFLLQLSVSFAGTTDIKGMLTKSSFIDPACIAPQFGYQSSSGCAQATNSAGQVIQDISGCLPQAGQSGSNTNNTNSLSNARFKTPTFLEMKVKIFGNLLRFVTQNITASKNGEVCANPMQDDECTVMQYQMPDGSVVTDDSLYKYVVYSTLYDYLSNNILEENKLEDVRKIFKEGYSNADPDTFEVRIKKIINQNSLFINGGLNNQKTKDLSTLIDGFASKLAKSVTTDALFFQKLGYSSYARLPITARLVECLDGTFANLFMRDLTNLPLTPYKIVQIYFQPFVILLLIIYVMVKGYSILMAHGIKDRNEVIMFFLKFSLIFYFAIGDAWKDFFYQFLKSIPTSVAAIVIDALPSSADGCTVYKSHMYPFGKGNIALFDMIDCKFSNYIGLPENSFLPGIFWIIVIPMIIPVPFVGWFISTLGIIYLSTVCYMILLGIQSYIVAIISLTLLLFLSPLVIPMILIPQLKDVYDKWLNKIIAVVIQMSMSILMIVITFAIMDSVLYGAKPEEYLFNVRPAISDTGQPQNNIIKDDCYDGNWFGADNGGGTNFLFFRGLTPVSCILYKYTKEGVQWIGFPIHNILWFFSIPFNFRFDHMLAFIIPCIVSLVLLSIIGFFIKPLQTLIKNITGEESPDIFGAAKYDTMAHGKEGAKAASTGGGGGGEKTPKPEMTPKPGGGGGDKPNGAAGGGAGGKGGGGQPNYDTGGDFDGVPNDIGGGG